MKKKAYDKAFNFNRMCTDENTKQMIQQILHNFEVILECCRSWKGGGGGNQQALYPSPWSTPEITPHPRLLSHNLLVH